MLLLLLLILEIVRDGDLHCQTYAHPRTFSKSLLVQACLLNYTNSDLDSSASTSTVDATQTKKEMSRGNELLSSMDVDDDEDEMPSVRPSMYASMGRRTEDVNGSSSSKPMLDIDELVEDDTPECALTQLIRAWVAERGAPVLLEWQGEVVDEVMSQVEEQTKIVDSLKSDDRSTDEEHFQLILVQTEVERAKYVITSYVRVRLSKVREGVCLIIVADGLLQIEEFAQYIVLNPSTHTNLSGIELSHARK